MLAKLPFRDLTLVAMLTLVCLVLAWMPSPWETEKKGETLQLKARVLQVDNSDLHTQLVVRTGSQRLLLEILQGAFSGQRIEAENFLLGKMELDEVYAQGNLVLVDVGVRDGTLFKPQLRGRYRLYTEWLLVGLFALLLISVAGWTGFKALLSFFFAGLLIWKVMIPAFLLGYDPILVALLVVAALTAVISFLVGGLTRQGVVCFLGAFSGLALTALLAVIFTRAFHIHGAVRPFAETLLYSGFYHLDLSRIFIAGIFLAAGGAVMDMAMDISASMREVLMKQPDISFWAHVSSGMRVGRAVIGTMTTTLLLAYSGGYTFMLMLFVAQGVPLANVFNLNYVAAEVLNTLVGSFGLVTVAPFTALCGGFIYRRR
jgi:uncharacterized membrane protein